MVKVEFEIKDKHGRRHKYKGELLKEYPTYYLVQLPTHKTCINKASLIGGDVKMVSKNAGWR